MMNFREICKTIFFCIASVNLGISSELEILGILFAILFVALHIKQYLVSKSATNQRKIPRYRKLFAYGAIVPCALWWVLTPSVEMGVSPYLVFIPAWYLLYLSFLQKRSLGNGGYEVFVVFNGVAALFMGLFQAPRGCAVSALVALILAVYAFGRPRVALYKRLLFVLMFAGLGCSSYIGFGYWKNNRVYSGRWAEEYYIKNRVMGFDPVASLGSFSSNYNSKFNDEIVLRVWDTLAPSYLRAAAYEKYAAGVWKLPTQAEKKLYPARYRVDYAVFETEDSVAAASDVKSVWVQATLDNFGFMFAAPNVVGVASKNADSLDYYSTNVFAGANGHRSDWYYYVPDSAKALAVKGEVDSSFLQLPQKNLELLDSIAVVMSLPNGVANPDSALYENPEYVKQNLQAIESYFARHFSYKFVVQGRRAHTTTDPLALFWKNKSGYCEYYATLASLLLRHQGIPARYVTGFARPEYIQGRPYKVFRRRHSHAWVEVYHDHQWFIFDPTPPMVMNVFAKPSWISVKVEGLKGRFSYMLHLLKDGEWRRVVDSWQTASERLVTSPVPYVVLALLLLVFAGLKIRKSRQGDSETVASKDAVRWIALLDEAERILMRLGFVRGSGETVSAFACRVRQTSENILKEEFARAGASTAKIERRQRELSVALKRLDEYEENRWRNS